jgi:DNA mismatch repair protein MutS2
LHIKELKSKLDFDSVLERVERYFYSALGSSKCDELEFMNDREHIEAELKKVVEFKELLNHSGDVPLDGLSDIREILNKIRIEGHFVAPEDFLRIHSFLVASRKLRKHVMDANADSDGKFPWIASYCSSLYFDKILEHNIEITIDESGIVKDSASANLSRIRKQITQQSGRLRKSLSEILKKIAEKEYTQEDIVTQRDGRYVIPVKTENKRSVQGIIHGASSTGQTVFVEPAEIITLNNELTELHFEERREIDKILRELASQVAKVSSELLGNCMILADIDFIQAKAKYAIETISSMPVITENEVDLIDAYHPVLLQTHTRSQVVPLKFRIGNEFNTLVISGPNAGGKTVVLKTVGLCHLMLQFGFLIPAEPESKVKIFSSIFVSIGDEQSIENDLSTFSSHLISVKTILDEADSGSLVLIDEIASGTDPVLGSALSSAILKTLSDRNAFSVVTTHNSELKEFAYATPQIENASLEFDSTTLSPTFRFITGLPGQSFTFEIAKKFDFPESIIADSKSYLTENENRLEDLLCELNETKQNYDALKRKTDIENVRLSGLSNLYDEKLNELRKNEKVLKQKAKLEAEGIVKDARKLIEKTVKEIREEKISPKQAKEIIAEEEKNLEIIIPDEEANEAISSELSAGDIARLKGSNTSGEVMHVSGNEILLNINGFTVRVPVSDIEKIQSKPKKESLSSGGVELNEKPVQLSLDLRGKFSYEVKDILERFLYDSVVNGLTEVSIIHGKGSGKLREEVRRQLKETNIVKSYRAGNWNEGDAGVTIVEL